MLSVLIMCKILNSLLRMNKKLNQINPTSAQDTFQEAPKETETTVLIRPQINHLYFNSFYLKL